MESERFFTVAPDVKLYYRLSHETERRRPLLVLLHGMASNLTRWSEFLENTSLKESFDILRVDLRGHGKSFTRARIGMPIWCDDLAKLLDSLGYEKAIFVGHSLGANIALWFATRYADRLDGICMIDPVFTKALRGSALWIRRCSPIIRAAAEIVRLLNLFGWRRREIPQRDLRKLDEEVRVRLLGTGKSKEFVQRYTSPLADLEYFPTAHYLQESIEITRPIPSAPEPPVPMLALISQAVTFTDTGVTRQALARYPRCELKILTAYHWPLTEKPTEVRQEIEKWCAQFVTRTTSRLID